MQARRTFAERDLFTCLASFLHTFSESRGEGGWHGPCSLPSRINGDPKNFHAAPTMALSDKGVLLA